MEIAPIPGIRTFGLTNVQRVDVQAPRFEVDALTRTDDETYSPSSQTPDRGLEEEEAATEEPEKLASDSDLPPSGTIINLIA
jgi:hypothetical protein